LLDEESPPFFQNKPSTMKRVIYILLACALVLGCAKPEEPLYQGLTLKTWVERLESSEPEVRADAVKVIQGIGLSARPAENSIRQIARNDPYPDVRILAVEALEAMGASTLEFQNLLEAYHAPVIPEEEELPEFMDEEAELLEHISGADDIAFLQAIIEYRADTGRLDTTMVPTDSAELAQWIEERRSDAISGLLHQIENPTVLALILEAGNLIERQFAARMLADMEGEDSRIIQALERAVDDPDSLVRSAAFEALKRWEAP